MSCKHQSWIGPILLAIVPILIAMTFSFDLRCIPKMDHHCPWTVNCVSHTTFPHFIRFVFYAVAAMTYLEYFLYLRAEYLWQNRNLPSVGTRSLLL